MIDRNARLQDIFRNIDPILWDAVHTSCKSMEFRLNKMESVGEEAKEIISTYIDAKVDMISGLITSVHFRRYPLPRDEIQMVVNSHADAKAADHKQQTIQFPRDPVLNLAKEVKETTDTQEVAQLINSGDWTAIRALSKGNKTLWILIRYR